MFFITALLATAALAGQAAARQDAGQHDPDDHSHGIHFTHPLFTDSVSPDTKVRLDYSRPSLSDEADVNETEFEGEYAFTEFFGIEAGIHYEADAGEFGETHVIFKFANPSLAESEVHLGYGLELGLPTGGGHAHGGVHEEEESAQEDGGEDIYEFTPFLNAGWIAGAWELSGWTLFEIPTNQGEQDGVGVAIRYNGSLLFHASPRIDGIIEAFGHAGLSGPETDRTVLNLAPGLRVRPATSRPLVIGVGLGLPVTSDEDYESHLLVSAFWHF